ncbi:MAG: hypothetical protein ABI606_07110 [Rhodoferax sp.]
MGVIKCVFAGLVTILLLSACEGKNTSQPEVQDPIKSIQTLMTRLQKAIDATEPEISPPSNDGDYTEWYKRKIYTSGKMQFDVVKTNSVVSPLLGKIDFECNTRFVKGVSLDEVKDTQFTGTADTPCRATYALQENRWVFKEMSCLKLTALTPNDFQEVSTDTTSVLGQCRAIAIAITSKAK